MKKRIFYNPIGTIFFKVLIILLLNSCSNDSDIQNVTIIDRLPVIDPDYSETIIPPNIAPLNFLIKEEGLRYHVKIFSKKGDSIEISSNHNKVVIPIKSWKSLLDGRDVLSY